ncbi:hypothetical protein G2W53_007130 [Senna tora]|uniref:Uncharacterized protein n=1 Tax=Senna tora TaxID=362788 RepID=A0A834X728_9FABA|nr:hypothetical protein G2W53_007130 [Senna tora]
MGPERWLKERSRVSNPLSLPKDFGMKPESSFLAKNRLSKLRQVLIELGISPDKRLSEKSRVETLTKFPTS